jgi:altronate hydrolase
MENNALKINEKDNVAIAMHDIKKGETVVIDGQEMFDAIEDIEAGHKIALSVIASGDNVYRYGEPIVEATRAIQTGEWAHVHNTQPIKGELKE